MNEAEALITLGWLVAMPMLTEAVDAATVPASGPLVAEVAALVASGRARAWGIGNWPADQLTEAVQAARSLGVPLPAAAQLPYSLVMAEDSDASQNKISTTSPIGRGLMGKKEGDEVEITTPAGKRRFEIVKLTTVHDKAD